MKKVQILFEVSLNVPERSIYGFLGPNGAGKTTLIHLIVGLRKPVSGSVKISGYEASSLEARSRVGYLPERPYFHEHLTAEDMLRFFGALAGMKKNHILSRIPKVLSIVGLTHARKLELRKFSKGMLQRVGIAQALLHDPEFLVLDEPMSGLDPIGRKEMRELLIEQAREGRTLFFSSHVIPDVEAVCDQVAMIHKGKLMGSGPIGSFLSGKPQQTEIAFHGISKETAKQISDFDSLKEMPDGFRALVGSQSIANEALRKLIAQKATILWVTPIRPNLESLFMDKLGGGG